MAHAWTLGREALAWTATSVAIVDPADVHSADGRVAAADLIGSPPYPDQGTYAKRKRFMPR